MSKKIIIILSAAILALGVGYVISRQTNNGVPNKQNNTNTTPNSETSGAVLDLSGQQLTTLPESILSRTDIATLNVSNNQLTRLPSDITKLTNLEVLSVENNRLESLPPEVSQLKKLREIRANNNRMTSLPSELDNMAQLIYLDISGNNIPPSQIEQLKASLTNTEIKT